MNSSDTQVLSGPFRKVYLAASAYIDMDYRKPLGLRDAIRKAVYDDLVEKQSKGISMTFITKNHRTYTDGIRKKVEAGYQAVEKSSLSRLSYWSMTVTACLGIYLLARLMLLDIGEETPYALMVTPRRLLTFIGLLVTLELVSLLIRRGSSKKVRYLTGFLLVTGIAMISPLFPSLGKSISDVSLFRLNLSIVFVCSLTVALASFGTRMRRSPGLKKNASVKKSEAR